MEVRRLFDFIYYQAANHPMEKAISYKNDGQWIHFSTQDIITKANQLSRGLLKLGVKKGDKIAIAVYQNRTEWVIADIAIGQIGAVTVPVYPTISAKDYTYIFNNAEVRYAFVGKHDLAAKVQEAQKSVPSLEAVFAFDLTDGTPFWETLFETDDQSQVEVERIKAGIETDDLATLIYTSGTTGNPKGVMLSHKNIISNVVSMIPHLEPKTGETTLSFLPICHVFERNVTYSYIYNGCSVYQTSHLELVGPEGDLMTIKPHYFTTVPRLLEKIYESIYNKGLALEGPQKEFFFWALSLADGFEFDKDLSEKEKEDLAKADTHVFSNWRAAFGGNLKAMAVGAAPCPKHLVKVFSTAGIRIREGYGLTETAPTLTINSVQKHRSKVGTVGSLVPEVEVSLDIDGSFGPDEGEILAAGPNIMLGYYKNPEATAEVIFEKDGKRWFRTGDVGRLVTNAAGVEFVQITDRKKELLKTSGGKYVAPSPIEATLKEDFLVEQVMVVGEKRKFISAIILPAPEALQEWAKRAGIESTDLAALCKNEQVVAKFQEIVSKVNSGLGHTSSIKKFTLLADTWEFVKTDGSDPELTPTMKPKRRVIRKKYKAEIDAMYSNM